MYMLQQVVLYFTAVCLAIFYRRVILRDWRIRKMEKTVEELTDFIQEHYDELISKKYLTQDQIAQHFNCNFWKKFYVKKFNSEEITFSSVKELRKELSTLCNYLREQIEMLQRLYGENCLPMQYEELVKEATRKIRGVMWLNSESWNEPE